VGDRIECHPAMGPWCGPSLCHAELGSLLARRRGVSPATSVLRST
jgi:hypothetical protein